MNYAELNLLNYSLMKHQIMFLGVFVSFLGTAQQNTVATGGNASSAQGSVSYSIGQIDFETSSNANGTVSQGVQQPYEIYPLAVDELFSSLEINLFPNPTSDFIHLTIGDLSNNLSYQLTDASGRLIQSARITENSTQIDVQDLSTASYFLNVFVGDQPAKSFTLIKNH
jgi:hypothetical protein